jgi:hypothetical protein
MQYDIVDLSDEELDQVAGGSITQFLMNTEQTIGHELAQLSKTAFNGLNAISQATFKELTSIEHTISNDLHALGNTTGKNLNQAKETLLKGIKKF